MKTYYVLEDGRIQLADFPSLEQSIKQAERMLGILQKGMQTTYTVEDDKGVLAAAVTNRRIITQFRTSRENDLKKTIDGSGYILRSAHAKLIHLKDNDSTTDSVFGFDKANPNYVTVVAQICTFFGVQNLKLVTEAALKYAYLAEYARVLSQK